jgi:N-methylhydantoinase B
MLNPGDVVLLLRGGGAGFGPAERRDPRRVRDDLENGYISEQAARTVYGLED